MGQPADGDSGVPRAKSVVGSSLDAGGGPAIHDMVAPQAQLSGLR